MALADVKLILELNLIGAHIFVIFKRRDSDEGGDEDDE